MIPGATSLRAKDTENTQLKTLTQCAALRRQRNEMFGGEGLAARDDFYRLLCCVYVHVVHPLLALRTFTMLVDTTLHCCFGIGVTMAPTDKGCVLHT